MTAKRCKRKTYQQQFFVAATDFLDLAFTDLIALVMWFPKTHFLAWFLTIHIHMLASSDNVPSLGMKFL